MDASSLATLWVLIGLVVFLGILAYLGVFNTLAGLLDKRGEKIQEELDEARRLREEAQSILADYQRKRQDAEKEAEHIIAAAQRDAAAMTADAKVKAEDFAARRAAQAELKISQAEAQAIAEVKAAAANLAISAAENLLAEKVKGDKAAKILDESISGLASRLN